MTRAPGRPPAADAFQLTYGVGTRDPVTLAFAALVIPPIALVASGVPALRAARADPLIVMRAE